MPIEEREEGKEEEEGEGEEEKDKEGVKEEWGACAGKDGFDDIRREEECIELL